MNTALLAALQMSLFGALIVCALLAMRAIFRRTAPQWILYYAWIIVLARLLLPFGLTQTDLALPAAVTDAPAIVETAPDDAQGAEADSRSGLEAATDVVLRTSAGTVQLAWSWLVSNLWVVWVAGAAGVLLYKVTLYQGFVRYIRAGMRPIDDVALLDRVAELGERTGVRRPVELCVNPLASSALLLDSRNPCIVLPTADLPEEDLDYILLHELVHLKRHDAWYKWAVQIAVCVHWFNPLAHHMSREVDRDCELSCDETVLRIKGGEPQEYGATLLRAMASSGTYREKVPSVSLTESKELLRERMEIIAKSRKSVASTVLCLVLCVGLVLATGCSRIVILGGGRAGSKPESQVEQAVSPRPGALLDIRVDECPVVVEPADGDEVEAVYNDDRYEVSIEDVDGGVIVDCGRILDSNRREYIELRVPRDAFASIQLCVGEGFVGWASMPSACISCDVLQGAAILGLPSGFSGDATVSGEQSFLSVCSEDGFQDCNVLVEASGSLVNVPRSFSRSGSTASYVNGDGSSLVSASMTEGFLRVEDSDADAKIVEYIKSGQMPDLDDIRAAMQEDLPDIPDVDVPFAQSSPAPTRERATSTPTRSADSGADDAVQSFADGLASHIEERIGGAIEGAAEQVDEAIQAAGEQAADALEMAGERLADGIGG